MLEEYVVEKFKHYSSFIDVEARNDFKSKDVITLVIKCTHGFNQYAVRGAIINGKLTWIECSRCSKCKT